MNNNKTKQKSNKVDPKSLTVNQIDDKINNLNLDQLALDLSYVHLDGENSVIINEKQPIAINQVDQMIQHFDNFNLSTQNHPCLKIERLTQTIQTDTGTHEITTITHSKYSDEFIPLDKFKFISSQFTQLKKSAYSDKLLEMVNNSLRAQFEHTKTIQNIQSHFFYMKPVQKQSSEICQFSSLVYSQMLNGISDLQLLSQFISSLADSSVMMRLKGCQSLNYHQNLLWANEQYKRVIADPNTEQLKLNIIQQQNQRIDDENAILQKLYVNQDTVLLEDFFPPTDDFDDQIIGYETFGGSISQFISFLKLFPCTLVPWMKLKQSQVENDKISYDEIQNALQLDNLLWIMGNELLSTNTEATIIKRLPKGAFDESKLNKYKELVKRRQQQHHEATQQEEFEDLQKDHFLTGYLQALYQINNVHTEYIPNYNASNHSSNNMVIIDESKPNNYWGYQIKDFVNLNEYLQFLLKFNQQLIVAFNPLLQGAISAYMRIKNLVSLQSTILQFLISVDIFTLDQLEQAGRDQIATSVSYAKSFTPQQWPREWNVNQDRNQFFSQYNQSLILQLDRIINNNHVPEITQLAHLYRQDVRYTHEIQPIAQILAEYLKITFDYKFNSQNINKISRYILEVVKSDKLLIERLQQEENLRPISYPTKTEKEETVFKRAKSNRISNMTQKGKNDIKCKHSTRKLASVSGVQRRNTLTVKVADDITSQYLEEFQQQHIASKQLKREQRRQQQQQQEQANFHLAQQFNEEVINQDLNLEQQAIIQEQQDFQLAQRMQAEELPQVNQQANYQTHIQQNQLHSDPQQIQAQYSPQPNNLINQQVNNQQQPTQQPIKNLRYSADIEQVSEGGHIVQNAPINDTLLFSNILTQSIVGSNNNKPQENIIQQNQHSQSGLIRNQSNNNNVFQKVPLTAEMLQQRAEQQKLIKLSNQLKVQEKSYQKMLQQEQDTIKVLQAQLQANNQKIQQPSSNSNPIVSSQQSLQANANLSQPPQQVQPNFISQYNLQNDLLLLKAQQQADQERHLKELNLIKQTYDLQVKQLTQQVQTPPVRIEKQNIFKQPYKSNNVNNHSAGNQNSNTNDSQPRNPNYKGNNYDANYHLQFKNQSSQQQSQNEWRQKPQPNNVYNTHQQRPVNQHHEQNFKHRNTFQNNNTQRNQNRKNQYPNNNTKQYYKQYNNNKFPNQNFWKNFNNTFKRFHQNFKQSYKGNKNFKLNQKGQHIRRNQPYKFNYRNNTHQQQYKKFHQQPQQQKYKSKFKKSLYIRKTSKQQLKKQQQGNYTPGRKLQGRKKNQYNSKRKNFPQLNKGKLIKKQPSDNICRMQHNWSTCRRKHLLQKNCKYGNQCALVNTCTFYHYNQHNKKCRLGKLCADINCQFIHQKNNQDVQDHWCFHVKWAGATNTSLDHLVTSDIFHQLRHQTLKSQAEFYDISLKNNKVIEIKTTSNQHAQIIKSYISSTGVLHKILNYSVQVKEIINFNFFQKSNNNTFDDSFSVKKIIKKNYASHQFMNTNIVQQIISAILDSQDVKFNRLNAIKEGQIVTRECIMASTNSHQKRLVHQIGVEALFNGNRQTLYANGSKNAEIISIFLSTQNAVAVEKVALKHNNIINIQQEQQIASNEYNSDQGPRTQKQDLRYMEVQIKDQWGSFINPQVAKYLSDMFQNHSYNSLSSICKSKQFLQYPTIKGDHIMSDQLKGELDRIQVPNISSLCSQQPAHLPTLIEDLLANKYGYKPKLLAIICLMIPGLQAMLLTIGQDMDFADIDDFANI